MPSRRQEVVRSILEAIDAGARTLGDIADVAGVDMATVHYHLVRKRGAKKGKTLCGQGLVRAITKHASSREEGKRGQVYRHFVLTAKGEEHLAGLS